MKNEGSFEQKMIAKYKNVASNPSFCGNEWLYEIARKKKDKDWLKAAMWLIGRSYAAPLERRRYTKLTLKEQDRAIHPDLIKNVGRGDFYSAVAEKAFPDLKSKNLLDPISCNTYSFSVEKDNLICQADETLFGESIKRVFDFQGIIIHAIFETDKKAIQDFIERNSARQKSVEKLDLGTPEGVGLALKISFSSKFCHFLSPNTVFIYDGYSAKASSMCCKNLKIQKESSKLVQTMQRRFKTEKYPPEKLSLPYLKHCCNLYVITRMVIRSLGTALPTSIIPKTITRVADDVMLAFANE